MSFQRYLRRGPRSTLTRNRKSTPTRSSHDRPLHLESLEPRLNLSAVSAIESFPTLLGSESPQGPSSLGGSVAVDGDWAVAGATGDGDSGAPSGAAYIYHKQNNEWVFQSKILDPDAHYGDGFGNAVAIDHNTIVIGAPRADGIGTDSGAVYLYANVAGTWVQQTKLVAPDTNPSGYFGGSVAMDGDTLVIGAQPSNYPSAAYVFERSNNLWSETAEFNPASPTYLEEGYGFSVAVDGDTIAVGESSSNVSATYLYQRTAAGWAQTDRLVPTDHNNYEEFGYAVALHGDTLVVGSPRAGVNQYTYEEGKADIYTRSNGHWVWTQSVMASDPTVNMYFGSSIAFDGQSLVIGANGRDWETVAGAAYLFKQDATNAWTQVDKFQAVDDQRGAYFAQSIALDGNEVLVGEPRHPDGDRQPIGAVHKFEFANVDAEVSLISLANLRTDEVSLNYAVQGTVSDLTFRIYRSADEILDPEDLNHLVISNSLPAANTLGTFTFDPGQFDPSRPYLIAVAQTAATELHADNNVAVVRQIPSVFELESYPLLARSLNDPSSAAGFGYSIAVEGNLAVISAPFSGGLNYTSPGAVYVMEKVNGDWMQRAVLSPADGQPLDEFGEAVAISGGTIVVGSGNSAGQPSQAGAAYVFTLVNGAWVQQAKLVDPSVHAGEWFGEAVAIDGDTIVVGTNNAGSYTVKGSALVFHRDAEVWSKVATLQETTSTAWFGISVAIEGDHILVGDAYGVDSRHFSTGTVYLYQLQGTTWTLQLTLNSPDNAHADQYALNVLAFGGAVAIKDNEVLIAASGRAAYAYVYQLVNNTLVWEATVKHSDPLAANFVPHSVAIDGDRVLLGDFSRSTDNWDYVGSAYLFQRQADGQWIEEPSVVGTSTKPGDGFGYAVAFYDGNPLIGDYNGGSGTNPTGVIAEFEPSAIDANIQLSAAQLTSSQNGEVSYAIQGTPSGFTLNAYTSADPVLDSGDLAHLVATQTVTGSNTTGAADFDLGTYDPLRPYVIFVASATGAEASTTDNQIALKREVPEFALEQFPTVRPDSLVDITSYGYALAVDGDLAVVGAPQKSEDLYGTGAAYVLQKINGRWVQEAQLFAPIGDYAGFGLTVAISGHTIVVGAPGPSWTSNAGGEAFVFTGDGADWSLTQQLVSNDAHANDGFGTTVAIDGDTILVAAESSYYTNTGNVYVFEKTGSQWNQTANLVDATNFQSNSLKNNIAISGDTIVIGNAAVVGTQSVSYHNVNVYQRVNGAWTYAATISSPDQSSFGDTLSLDGDTLVVSSTKLIDPFNSRFAGADTIYRRVNDQWTYVQTLQFDKFGTTAVKVNGDYLVLSGNFPYNGPNGQNVTYLYKRSEDGVWLQHATLDHAGIVATDVFGYAVAIDGSSILVSAPYRDGHVADAGDVFAYDISSFSADANLYAIDQPGVHNVIVSYAATGFANPVQVSVYRSTDNTLDPSDLLHQVTTVALTNGVGTFLFDPGARDLQRPYLIVAATPTESEFTEANNVLSIQQIAPLGLGAAVTSTSMVDPGGTNTTYFGTAVAVDGDRAVVGAYLDHSTGVYAGAAYVMHRVNGVWTQEAKLLPDASATNTDFGYTVAIEGNTVLVGAYLDQNQGYNAGAIYIYQLTGKTWTRTAKLLGDYNSFFGYSVAIDNGTIVVGEYNANSGYGAACVYEQQDGVWTQAARLNGYFSLSSSHQLLGMSVAIHGNTIAVAAPNLTLDGQSTYGAVVIWTRDSTGWEFSQIVSLPDSFDSLDNGITLAMSDSRLVVGTPNLRVSQLDYAGGAYVFHLVNGQWQFQQELTSSSPSHWGAFGQSVAVDGNTILVMATDVSQPVITSKSIHVYHERSDGRWIEDLQIATVDTPAKTYLSGPLAFDGKTLLVHSFTGDIQPNSIWGFANEVEHVTAFELLYPTAPQLPGDFNGDSVVNLSDYVVWRRTAGKSVVNYASADGNGDGLIDQADYEVWRSHFGQTMGITPIGATNIAAAVGNASHALSATAANSALATAEYSELIEKTLSVADYQIAPATCGSIHRDSLDRRNSANLLELIWKTHLDPLENVTSTIVQVAGHIQHDQPVPSDFEAVCESVQSAIFETLKWHF